MTLVTALTRMGPALHRLTVTVVMAANRGTPTMQDIGQTTGAPGTTASKLPLCVDFDKTLSRTDSLCELFVAALKSQPITLLSILPLALRSRAAFKRALWSLASTTVNVSSFPREARVVALVEQARREGRWVELVSSSDAEMLRSDPSLVATFDEILGSNGATNLNGSAKAALLQARHPLGFEYVGNGLADGPVFAVAAKGYGVGLSATTERVLSTQGGKVERLVPRSAQLGAFVRSLRLHQWFKNVLIFVPVGLGLASLSALQISRSIVGFVLLGVMASATYFVNDLFDLPSDRQHPRKSRRPLASGDLHVMWALIAAPAMIAFTILSGALLEPSFGGVLALYLVTTLAYSFALKQTPVIDAMVIGLLFTLRVVAGMTLGTQPSSQWLLVFSVFFFTGLALMKRDAEIALRATFQQRDLQGRGYNVGDRAFVQITGIATSVASLVILALFIVATFEDGRQYSAPYFLWAAHFLLAYWMLRLWFASFRGTMNDDPIEFAIKDPVSLAIFLGIGAVCVLAQLL